MQLMNAKQVLRAPIEALFLFWLMMIGMPLKWSWKLFKFTQISSKSHDLGSICNRWINEHELKHEHVQVHLMKSKLLEQKFLMSISMN